MAGDALRSELIFLDGAADATRIDDFVVIRTPENPTYWWGNTIEFDTAPRDGDFARWTGLFRRYLPDARHATFGWEGDDCGVIEPFVAAGFELLETTVLTAGPASPIAAPHVDRAVAVGTCRGDGWDELAELHVDTRDDRHSRADHTPYIERRVACWRRLAERGQGEYFGAWADGRLLAGAGVFVEAAPGADGRRIGRFQQVSTRIEARRRGLAGMLVAAAARHAFDQLGADRILIMADENAAPRRVYESVGFRPTGRQRGLQRAP